MCCSGRGVRAVDCGPSGTLPQTRRRGRLGAIGKWTILPAISVRRASLRATSRSTRKASASRRVNSRLAASSSRLSSWSRIAVSLTRVSQPCSLSLSRLMTSLRRLPVHIQPVVAAARVAPVYSLPQPCRRPAEPRPPGESGSGRRCAGGGRRSRRARPLPGRQRDANLHAADRHLHALADQAPGYAVAVAIDCHAQSACTRRTSSRLWRNGGRAVERRQRCRLVPLETD